MGLLLFALPKALLYATGCLARRKVYIKFKLEATSTNFSYHAADVRVAHTKKRKKLFDIRLLLKPLAVPTKGYRKLHCKCRYMKRDSASGVGSGRC